MNSAGATRERRRGKWDNFQQARAKQLVNAASAITSTHLDVSISQQRFSEFARTRRE
jgi:hypothetical protein